MTRAHRQLRPAFVRLVLAFAVAWACISSANAQPDERSVKPPHIVVFTVDDMDFTSVNAFGNPMPGLSPNIDRLVREGTSFINAHVSTPSCAPCRQSMMTGKHPHANGSYGFLRVSPQVTSLTDLLRQRGYFTGSIGKGGAYGPFEWDAFVGFTPQYGRDPQGYVDATREMLDQARQQGKPFYLGINTSDPHRPFAGSDQEQQYIAHRRRQHPEWDNPPAPVFPAFTTPEAAYLIPYLPDLGPVRRDLAEYYSSTRRADHILGLILELFEQEQLLDETLFVFFSDHAAPFPLGKNNLFKHSTQTPLILRWPGRVSPNVRLTGPMVSTLDLMPTLLEVVDVTVPDDLDGQSLLPLLRGEPQPRRDVVFTTNNFKWPGKIVLPSRAVTTPRYSYIWNPWADGRRKETENMRGRSMQAIENAAAQINRQDLVNLVDFIRYRRVDGELVQHELYELSQDPWSQHNLAADPEYTDLLEEMKALMSVEMQRTRDPLLKHFHGDGGYPAWWDDASQIDARGFKPVH